jgi:hypothetical protein
MTDNAERRAHLASGIEPPPVDGEDDKIVTGSSPTIHIDLVS